MSSKTLFIFVVLVICVASVYLKFQVTDQALPYSAVPDTQNAAIALKNSERYETSEGFYQFKDQTKYPLFTTYLYIAAMKITGIWDYPDTVKLLRDVHVLMYIMVILFLLMFPFEMKFKLLALLLLSISLTAHFYFVVGRIHAPVGAMVFMTLFFILKMICQKNFSSIYFILSAFFLGLSMSTFFSGAFMWITLSVGLYICFQERKINFIEMLSLNAASIIMSLLIFSYFYPGFLLFLRGESPLFQSFNYGHYFGYAADERFIENSVYSGEGILEYITRIWDADPLLWSGYFLGLFFLFKNGLWKRKEWLLLLVSIIPYQIFMSFVSTNQSRRDLFFIPIMSVMAAYGWHTFLVKNQKMRIFFILLTFFMMATILKYQYLTKTNTQTKLYNFVNENVDENSYIMLSERLPPFEYLATHGKMKKINAIKITDYRKFLKSRLQSDSAELREILTKHSLSKNSYLDKDLNPIFFEKYDYLILNQTEAVDDMKSTQSIRKQFSLIKNWPKDGQSTPIFPQWPGESGVSLWKLWNADYVGPQISVYTSKHFSE